MCLPPSIADMVPCVELLSYALLSYDISRFCALFRAARQQRGSVWMVVTASEAGAHCRPHQELAYVVIAGVICRSDIFVIVSHGARNDVAAVADRFRPDRRC